MKFPGTENLYLYRVKNFVKIVDGDTVDFLIDLGFNVTLTQRFRLAGINTPELRSGTAIEKESGRLASKFFEDWVLEGISAGRQLYVWSRYKDKYGRFVGELFSVSKENDYVRNYSEDVLEAGLASEYLPKGRQGVQGGPSA
jgi:micrococcal nuclease